MTGERPCFISDAQAREFEMLVRYVMPDAVRGDEASVNSTAKWLAGLSGIHEADAIARCALADAALARREAAHA